MRLTNRNGQLDQPVRITVPDKSAGQNQDTGIIPFSTVDLYARHEDYEQIIVENLQIFPDVVTTQDLEMIPLSELPESWNLSQIFQTQKQNL